MVVRLANNFRVSSRNINQNTPKYSNILKDSSIIPQNAKLLAWGIFLIFFIENGTLGLIPKQYYFVYRNVRISDLLLYGLTLYSLYNNKEFYKLFKSKALIIPKLILLYLLFQFIMSSILYEYNPIEFFFRLKGIWMSMLVFPFLLLLQRNGFGYLIKLILPVAVVSNILYILSAITGIKFLPEIGIAEQSLPGGLKVFRVYGGTFYGELFFLGFIYYWITKKFRLYQLGLTIIFIIPHILAFGRSAWTFFSLTIIFMLVWYALKKREFRVAFRQIIIFSILGVTLIYAFIKLIPQSDYMLEAIEARIIQGQEDIKFKEGTYGTRIANIQAMINLWQSTNIFVGIGMHPMWVVKPETAQEVIYAWGFSDVGWASVLTAYGLIGFILAIIFQLYYFINAAKILRQSIYNDILIFFVLVFFSRMFFDSVINITYAGLTVGLWGFFSSAFYIAALVYKKENINSEYKL